MIRQEGRKGTISYINIDKRIIQLKNKIRKRYALKKLI